MRVSRPQNALAYATLAVFAALALTNLLGTFGEWSSHGMRAAFGYAAWALPAMFARAAWRALTGQPPDWRRRFGTVFSFVVVCTTLGLFEAPAGWVGIQSAVVLKDTIDVGAYVIVFGVWVGAVLRALGAERVQAMVDHSGAVLNEVSQKLLEHRGVTLRFALPAPTPRLLPAQVTAPARLPAPALALPPVPAPEPVATGTYAPTVIASQRAPSSWKLPSNGLFQAPTARAHDRKALEAVAKNIEERLRMLKVDAAVEVSQTQGALVYRFDLTPGPQQKISQIKDRQEDLETFYKGLCFVDMSGTGKLGIEISIPEEQRGVVCIREVLDSSAWVNSNATLPLVLGATSSGEPTVIDLAKCPHLLVAGQTGGGKSVGLNVMMTSILMHNSPDQVKAMLLDPKGVELAEFADLPHLIAPVITDKHEMAKKLEWAVKEMNDRYKLFLSRKTKNLDGFNASYPKEALPRLVIVIDEYADLVMIKAIKQSVEDSVVMLAQKARAAGIHVILATQRPDVNVITGLIKANFPSRLAYRVSQRQDSQTILGDGCWPQHKQLVGNGDSLVIMNGKPGVTRVHGAYVSDEEVAAVCDMWRRQASFVAQSASAATATARATDACAEGGDDDIVETAPICDTKLELEPEPKAQPQQNVTQIDELYEQAVQYARGKQNVSMRMLTEDLHWGTPRAKRMFERMRENGLLKPGGTNNTHVFVEPNQQPQEG